VKEGGGGKGGSSSSFERRQREGNGTVQKNSKRYHLVTFVRGRQGGKKKTTGRTLQKDLKKIMAVLPGKGKTNEIVYVCRMHGIRTLEKRKGPIREL